MGLKILILLRSVFIINFIIDLLTNIFLDEDVRWNSTFNLLKNFLILYPAIKSTIEISKDIKDKNEYSFSNNEIEYIRQTFEIFTIFTKPSEILQGSRYPTIEYVYPYVYLTRYKLDRKYRDENLVSKLFFNRFFLYCYSY